MKPHVHRETTCASRNRVYIAKLRMPKPKLPKVRLSRHSDEIDGAADIKGSDKTKVKMPSVDITSPKVDLGVSSGKAEANVHTYDSLDA